MVNQYNWISPKNTNKNTHYDFFKTGGDGLYWDCINVIGLANGLVEINNTSPIWSCAINGKSLSLFDVDISYIHMIEDWLLRPFSNWDYAVAAHKKVAEMEAYRCQKS
jgi:hypothetical protein